MCMCVSFFKTTLFLIFTVVPVLNLRYPWHCLIFSGKKNIENRNKVLKDGTYAVYAPVKSDWKEATSNSEIRKDIESLKMKSEDYRKYTGFIIGLIEISKIKTNNKNSIYWDDKYTHHYEIKNHFSVDANDYIQFQGKQGPTQILDSDVQFTKLKEWEKCMKQKNPTTI